MKKIVTILAVMFAVVGHASQRGNGGLDVVAHASQRGNSGLDVVGHASQRGNVGMAAMNDTLGSVSYYGAADSIPQMVMQAIYDEVRTPYKYGLVVAPSDNYHKFDCPTVWREGDKWLMTYVCYDGKDGKDGRGYETWLAESDDLLHWTTLGRVLSLPPTPSQGGGAWDQNQRGGFPALIDWTWGGSYEMAQFKGRHWMTYIGGPGTGYEAVNAPLSIGLASTKGNIATAHQWDTQDKPLLSYDDKGAQWWEQLTQYKSTVYDLRAASPLPCRGGVGSGVSNSLPADLAKHRFLMFYNAGGINPSNNLKAERIGIAFSDDMKKWTRYSGNPVFANEVGGIITGDAQIVVNGQWSMVNGQWSMVNGQCPLYVMFYFKAYDPSRKYNAFNTFAVSRDLIHWQDWNGPDLIIPSKPYDELFAHKSYVVKHDGVVYHFYCAVNNAQQRGIAVATSVPMGQSALHFPEPEPTGKRRLTSLNNNWQALCVGRDSIATNVNLPHNFDDYYGYRQLRHGNLHGSAIYNKMFACEKRPDRRYFLEFQGVGTYATVTLNGHTYPRELVGRTVWTLDVSDAILHGENRLQVLVDHPAMQTESPWVCGGCSSEYGFSEGSQPFGIFRPVTLVETDEVRIEPFGVHIWANSACDSVFIETEVKNYGSSPASIELVSKLAEKSGKAVFRLSQNLRLAPGEMRTVRQCSPVANAHRWSPNDPYLYTLTSMVKQPEHRDGDANPDREPALVTTDDVRTPFGIRTLSWPIVAHASQRANQDAPVVAHASQRASSETIPTLGSVGYYDNRFRLNGLPVFINGTCEYEHLLGCSHAFTPEQIAARIKLVRNAGFNALREAHQPHNLRYQQLCDEQGLLFWSQFSAHIWYDTPQFRETFKRMLTRWIKERRNSPSVILWGLQNESILPRDFAEECSDIIRRLDPTAVGGDLQSPPQRLITTCNGGEGTDWNVIQNWSGTYGGSPENYAEELSRPDQLLNGEYGAWRTLDLHGSARYSEESFTALLALKDSLAHAAFVVGHASQRGSSCHPTISDTLGSVSYYSDTLGSVSYYSGTLGSVPYYGVCGHFQWLLTSHDNPGRVQPDGALRRIDRVGPVNYKGLTTIWEEPTQAYHMYRNRHTPPFHVGDGSVVVPPSDRDRTAALPSLVGEGSGVGSVTPSVPFRAGGGSPAAPTPGYRYLYRINCGGDAFTDEFGQTWQADDSTLSHSWGQDFEGIHPFQASQRHITADIRGTKSDELFQRFRFGRHRLWYDLPVDGKTADREYRIELYFAEPWHGKDDYREEADYEGLRIFDVAINDSTVIDDLDLWAEAGYCGALKRVVYAPAKDGHLRISFPEVKAGQAVIAGIAVAAESDGDDGVNGSNGLNGGKETMGAWVALDTDTIAKLPVEELPQDADPRPATIYEPVSSNLKPQTSNLKSQTSTLKSQPSNLKSQTTFTITPGLGQEYALRFRYKNTTGSAVQGRLTITDSKGIVLVDRSLTFPPTPDKFKMLSTTTGTQINAGTYQLVVDADGVEFKNLEMQ